MGCLVALFALISPRLALFAIFLFSDLLSDSFDSWWLPLLGFFVLPWTTLAYAVMWAAGTNDVTGVEWFFVVLGFLLDIGAYAQRGRFDDYRGRALAPAGPIRFSAMLRASLKHSSSRSQPPRRRSCRASSSRAACASGRCRRSRRSQP